MRHWRIHACIGGTGCRAATTNTVFLLLDMNVTRNLLHKITMCSSASVNVKYSNINCFDKCCVCRCVVYDASVWEGSKSIGFFRMLITDYRKNIYIYAELKCCLRQSQDDRMTRWATGDNYEFELSESNLLLNAR